MAPKDARKKENNTTDLATFRDLWRVLRVRPMCCRVKS
jgi:hypothetical protein